MRISVQFFAAAGESAERDKYGLLLEAAMMIDDSTIDAIWLPERHFVDFGGLYPNPAVLGAAVATVTARVGIRSGSVILPLHDPLRVAEEWSVVDNLSGGRVELSFGSGWNVNDFVLAPDRYEARRRIMWEDLEEVRGLWRGESVVRRNGAGVPHSVRTLPAPLQPELPVWITAQSDSTFAEAAAAGFPVLTNLSFTTPGATAARCAHYREHLTEATRTSRCRVAVMVHTFVGETTGDAKAHTTTALRGYLESNLSMREDFSAGKSADGGTSIGRSQRDALVARGTERIQDWAGLIGDEDVVLRRMAGFAEQGVDELACLVDFGVDADETLRGLERLCRIAEKAG